MSEYCTIYHILPEVEENFPTKRSDVIREIQEVKVFLDEIEKPSGTMDEIVFLALINRKIEYFNKNAEIFKRAKTLVAKERFTVEYKGSQSNPNPTLEDFEIIPIKKASD